MNSQSKFESQGFKPSSEDNIDDIIDFLNSDAASATKQVEDMSKKEVGAQMEKIFNEINLMKQRKDELKIRN